MRMSEIIKWIYLGIFKPKINKIYQNLKENKTN